MIPSLASASFGVQTRSLLTMKDYQNIPNELLIGHAREFETAWPESSDAYWSLASFLAEQGRI